MKAVVQRVSEASVRVNEKINGSIGKGLVMLIAVHKDDTEEQVRWVADKCRKLRIFEDEAGKMNRSLEEINGEILLISQFTLYGEVKKGTRPSFINSARPEKAKKMYEEMVLYLEKQLPGKIKTGIFAAHMDVLLVNDGPVTVIVER